MANLDQLRQHLDVLANRGAGYLRRYALKESVEAAMSHVHIVALIVPVVFAVLSISDRWFGTQVWMLGPIFTVLLAIVVPVAYVVFSGAFGFLARKVNRTYALALFDRELEYKDRLQAADEFLKIEKLSPFESAAVDDAIPYAEKAIQEKLRDIRIAAPFMHSNKWGHGVAALVLLVVGVVVDFLVFDTSVDAIAPQDELVAVIVEDEPPLPEPVVEPVDQFNPVVAKEKTDPLDRDSENVVLESAEGSSSDSALHRANPSTTNPTQSMQMGVSAGATQDNQAGSAASNLSGQGNPDKKREGSDDAAKERKNDDSPKKPSDEEQPKDESASGLAGGKGTGSGRQSSSAEMFEITNKVQQEDMDSDVDLESDDEEDEEQEAANTGRPFMNQRKSPVDRQLTPSGMVGNEENPDANGRGGAGGIKKTRGVAAMLLGVPMPDKLRSQINPGRVKIQRERAVPHPSDVAIANSESRGVIDESIGVVVRHELRPWMRNVVSKYFVSLREQPIESGE